MSGTKLTNWAYLDSDYEDEVPSKNILKKGWFNIEFSNFAATTESEIAAGSSVDIDGVMYLFGSLESITGTETASTTNYIRVFDSGGSAIAEYTTEGPTYDYDKKGWYDATGLKRYVLSFYFDGSDYLAKAIIDDLNLGNVKIVNAVATVTSDYTIPTNTNVKVYLVETTDTVKTTITLPDATLNEGVILKIIKSTSTFAPVVIDTYSTQTINSWNYTIDSVDYQLVPLFFSDECCELISDGSNWRIINNFVPTYDSGYVYHSGGDEFNIPRITTTGKSGSFELFEVVEGGTSGQRAIVCMMDDTNSRIWVLQSTPYDKTNFISGPFQSETITGGNSGATGTVSATATTLKTIYPFINQNIYELDTNKNLYPAPIVILDLYGGTGAQILATEWFLIDGSYNNLSSSAGYGQVFSAERNANKWFNYSFLKAASSGGLSSTNTGTATGVSNAPTTFRFRYTLKG